VGAVGPDGANFRVADFSNAPPDVVAPGVDIVSAALGGSLVADSGTSMACPCVAGLAALWVDELNRRGTSVDATTLRSHLISSTVRDNLLDFGADAIRDYGNGMSVAPGG
jgi:subtilisin family serine protease